MGTTQAGQARLADLHIQQLQGDALLGALGALLQSLDQYKPVRRAKRSTPGHDQAPGHEEDASNRRELVRGLILVLDRAQAVGGLTLQRCKDTVMLALRSHGWLWRALAQRAGDKLLASGGAVAFVADVLALEMEATQARVLDALADWFEGVDGASVTAIAPLAELATALLRASFAGHGGQLCAAAPHCPTAATAAALRFLVALEERRGLGAFDPGPTAPSTATGPVALVETLRTQCLTPADVTRMVWRWGQAGIADRAQHAQRAMLILVAREARGAGRDRRSALVAVATLIGCHWELAQFTAATGVRGGVAPAPWGTATCRAVLDLLTWDEEHPPRFGLAPPLLAHGLRLVADAWIGARDARRSAVAAPDVARRAWVNHDACVRGITAPHLVLHPGVRHGGTPLMRAYELHDMLSAEGRPKSDDHQIGAAPLRRASGKKRGALKTSAEVAAQRPVDLVALLLGSVPSAAESVALPVTENAGAHMTSAEQENGMVVGGVGGPKGAVAESGGRGSVDPSSDVPASALATPTDGPGRATGEVGVAADPSSVTPFPRLALGAKRGAKRIVPEMVVAPGAANRAGESGTREPGMSEPGPLGPELGGHSPDQNPTPECRPPAPDSEPGPATATSTVVLPRVVIRADPGMTDAERETLWAAYIADKESLLGLLGDDRYRDWFDEASAAPPPGTKPGGVEGALDVMFGGAADGDDSSRPQSPLDATVTAPWQAASAACLDLYCWALGQIFIDPGSRHEQGPTAAVPAAPRLTSDDDAGAVVRQALGALGAHGRQVWVRATQRAQRDPAGLACLALALQLHAVATRCARSACPVWLAAALRALRVTAAAAGREDRDGDGPGRAKAPLALARGLLDLGLERVAERQRRGAPWRPPPQTALDLLELFAELDAAVWGSSPGTDPGLGIQGACRQAATEMYLERRRCNERSEADVEMPPMLRPLLAVAGPARGVALRWLLDCSRREDPPAELPEAGPPDVDALRRRWSLSILAHEDLASQDGVCCCIPHEAPGGGEPVVAVLETLSQELDTASALLRELATRLDERARAGPVGSTGDAASAGPRPAPRDPRRAVDATPVAADEGPPSATQIVVDGSDESTSGPYYAALAMSLELAGALRGPGGSSDGVWLGEPARRLISGGDAMRALHAAEKSLRETAACQATCIELLRSCDAAVADRAARAMEAAPQLATASGDDGGGGDARESPRTPDEDDGPSTPVASKARRPRVSNNPYVLAVMAEEGAPRGFDAGDLADLDDFIVANPDRDYAAFIHSHFPRPPDSDSDEDGPG